jgi:hypothetical protein
MFAELSRNPAGCAILTQRNIVNNLIRVVRTAPSHDSTLEMRGALWSLGHIASNDLGYNLVMAIDSFFVEFCVDRVTTCPSYSIRGLFFYVLGLISRSRRGSLRLLKLDWYSVAPSANAAVTIPRDPSILFRNVGTADNCAVGVGGDVSVLGTEQMVVTAGASLSPKPPIRSEMSDHNPAAVLQIVRGGAGPLSTQPNPSNQTARRNATLLEVATTTNIRTRDALIRGVTLNTRALEKAELDVMNIVVKLPGVSPGFYRDSLKMLENIQLNSRSTFDSHALYLEVQSLFEVYSYRLSIRRDIMKLFSIAAKINTSATGGSTSGNSNIIASSGAVSGVGAASAVMHDILQGEIVSTTEKP